MMIRLCHDGYRRQAKAIYLTGYWYAWPDVEYINNGLCQQTCVA